MVLLFGYVSRQEFYRSYAQDEKEVTPTAGKQEINFRTVLSKSWIFHLAAFLNFFVTLGIFPTYFSLAETTSTNEVRKYHPEQHEQL